MEENCVQLQSNVTKLCGEYCLMFCYERSIGKSYEDYLANFKYDTSYNDWFIVSYLRNVLTFRPRKIYGEKTNVMGCVQQCFNK